MRLRSWIISAAAASVFFGSGHAAAEKTGGGGFGNENGLRFVREDGRVRSEWEILVDGGTEREYMAANKIAAHFCCESAGRGGRGNEGLFCAMNKYVDSWDLAVGGAVLDPSRITLARAYPHILYRWYGDDGIMEEIFLPDFENGLVVGFSGLPAGRSAFAPWVQMRSEPDVRMPGYSITWEKNDNVLLVTRRDERIGNGCGGWIAITSGRQLEFLPEERTKTGPYPRDRERNDAGGTDPFSPGSLSFTCGQVVSGDNSPGSVIFAVGLGTTAGEAMKTAKALIGGYPKIAAEKFARIDSQVRGGTGETGTEMGMLPPVPDGPDENMKAYRWARASMDNLIMDRGGRGIYASLHSSPGYRCRDTFISLPGACIATGRFDAAREILDYFLDFQQKDAGSPLLGRLPEIIRAGTAGAGLGRLSEGAPEDSVNTGGPLYTGVDGTWWFVSAAWKYFEATGDTEFLLKAWPVVVLAIEGAIGKATDDLGFLTHGDSETWMDAGGESNPLSPRGNRAVEVQALFHHGLLVGASWARMLYDLMESGGYGDDGYMWEDGDPGFDGDPGDTGDAGGAAGDDYESVDYGEEPVEAFVIPGDIDAGELARLYDRWTGHAALLSGNFARYFWNEKDGYLYDHLNIDGTADTQTRPNAVLAMWVYLDTIDLLSGFEFSADERAFGEKMALLGDEQLDGIVARAVEKLVTNQGVTSLSGDDPQFHTARTDTGKYANIVACHNGDVWKWLSGPMISCMMATGRDAAAIDLFRPLVAEILNGRCVGNLGQRREGCFTEGQDEFGGSAGEAGGLSEFLRISLEELGLDWQ